MDEYGKNHLLHHLEQAKMELTDDELIELVVRNQVSTIQAQIRFRNNPMWMPSRTPEQKEEDERLWQVIIDRGLVERVNELVKNKTEHIK